MSGKVALAQFFPLGPRFSWFFRIGEVLKGAQSQDVPMTRCLTASRPPVGCRQTPFNRLKPCLSKTITW